jgi:hypothetical protein
VLSDQMAAVITLLGTDATGGAGGLPPAAAIAAAEALKVDGICAAVGTGVEGAVLTWGKSETAAALDEAGFTLGEGPGRDCLVAGWPVLVADLSTARARWPAFAPAAMELGVRALFALPLRVGAISVGTLLVHRSTPGSLRDGQLVDALALADTLTVLLLSRGTDRATRAFAKGEEPGPAWEASYAHRLEVHQATGMVSVQLGVSLAEALLRLRAYAYAHERPLHDVTADVVARRLRLQDPSS